MRTLILLPFIISLLSLPANAFEQERLDKDLAEIDNLFLDPTQEAVEPNQLSAKNQETDVENLEQKYFDEVSSQKAAIDKKSKKQRSR